MKNALLATTALMLTVGVASADVSLSGYGRFGLSYQENAPLATGDETTLSYRLRLNIDASAEADNGLAFGGRVRLQQSNGQTAAALSPALLYVTYEGLRVEVGNANTAYDSVALMYNSEVGFQARSFGDPSGSYYSFNTGPYANGNRVGVLVQYAMGGLTARLSFVDPDQTVADSGALNVAGATTETGVSVDYTTGAITLAAAFVQDGNGINGNDQTFAGAAYAIDANTNVGLNYIDNGSYDDGIGGIVDNGTTIVLYGSRSFGEISAIAYVANNDAPGNVEDTAFGVGAGYDLGGAVLSAGLERGYDDLVRADMGIKFNF